jgi:hypothetical protein
MDDDDDDDDDDDALLFTITELLTPLTSCAHRPCNFDTDWVLQNMIIRGIVVQLRLRFANSCELYEKSTSLSSQSEPHKTKGWWIDNKPVLRDALIWQNLWLQDSIQPCFINEQELQMSAASPLMSSIILGGWIIWYCWRSSSLKNHDSLFVIIQSYAGLIS